jgi:phenylalanyl-tRNA synthetase beta chain
MKSDSSYRFERGIDPTLPSAPAVGRLSSSSKPPGGELLSGVAQAGKEDFSPRKITLRLERMRTLLGTDIPANEALDALRRLGLSPQQSGRLDHRHRPKLAAGSEHRRST